MVREHGVIKLMKTDPWTFNVWGISFDQCHSPLGFCGDVYPYRGIVLTALVPMRSLSLTLLTLLHSLVNASFEAPFGFTRLSSSKLPHFVKAWGTG